MRWDIGTAFHSSWNNSIAKFPAEKKSEWLEELEPENLGLKKEYFAIKYEKFVSQY